MKGSPIALLTALALAAPLGSSLSAKAEALPPPVGSGEVQQQPDRKGDPGFAGDVEEALDGLTTLQCTLLGVLFMNAEACERP